MDIVGIVLFTFRILSLIVSSVSAREVDAEPGCWTGLGMTDGGITDLQLSATSWVAGHSPWHARPGGQGWCPLTEPSAIITDNVTSLMNEDPYLEIDLLTDTYVDGLSLSFRPLDPDYVEMTTALDTGTGTAANYSFRIEYGQHMDSLTRSTEFHVVSTLPTDQTQTIALRTNLTARIIRFLPTVPAASNPCVRLELLGCRQISSPFLGCGGNSTRRLKPTHSVYLPTNYTLTMDLGQLPDGHLCIQACRQEPDCAAVVMNDRQSADAGGRCLVFRDDVRRNYVLHTGATYGGDTGNPDYGTDNTLYTNVCIGVEEHPLPENVTVTETSIIYSRGYPLTYPTGTTVRWHIILGTGSYIQLLFTNISLNIYQVDDSDEPSCGDKITIGILESGNSSATAETLLMYDKLWQNPVTITSAFNGYQPAYRTNVGQLTLIFQSCLRPVDSRGNGFRAILHKSDTPHCMPYYTADDDEPDTNWDVVVCNVEKAATLSSWTFDGLPAPPAARQWWRAEAPYLQQVTLRVTDFHVTCGSGSRLHVDDSGVRTLAFCNLNRPTQSVVSTYNRLTVSMAFSGDYFTGDGFAGVFTILQYDTSLVQLTSYYNSSDDVILAPTLINGSWITRVDNFAEYFQRIPFVKDYSCLVDVNRYWGPVSNAIFGTPCQAWNMQYPHKHSFTEDDMFSDGDVHVASNHCRNPSNNLKAPWCYTRDLRKRYHYCPVTPCAQEFYCFDNSQDYRGTESTTVDGRTCQVWVANSPHTHQYTDNSMFPDGSAAAAGNYCRDPDGDGQLWCFTVDPLVRWGYCDVYACGTEDYTCYSVPEMYNGTMKYTVSGRLCQAWVANTPHSHYNSDSARFPDRTALDAKNYCRDPDSEGAPWCYTTDPDVRWEFCSVPPCRQDMSCYKHAPSYRGTMSVTRGGLPCQNWTAQVPHAHKYYHDFMFPDDSAESARNYCRSPDDDTTAPWCITDSLDQTWDYCDVRHCDDDTCHYGNGEHLLHMCRVLGIERPVHVGVTVCSETLGKCYHLVHGVWTNWENAATFCHRRDSSLVSIGSRQEMDYLRLHLLMAMARAVGLGNPPRDPRYYTAHIGLSRSIDADGKMMESWADGSHVYFTAWAEGQPADVTQKPYTSMSFYPLSNGDCWSTANMESAYFFVCDHIIGHETTVEGILHKARWLDWTTGGDTVEEGNTFSCNNGEHVSILARCDGTGDCLDFSDEDDCTFIHGTNSTDCAEQQFKCGDGRCIAIGLWCDFVVHCQDATDEDCVYPSCTESEFVCNNGQCIPMASRCDATADCIDGSDELNCTTCNDDLAFICDNIICLPNSRRCDGMADCADSSDENGCDTPHSCIDWWNHGYRKRGEYTVGGHTVTCIFDRMEAEHVLELQWHNIDFRDLPTTGQPDINSFLDRSIVYTSTRNSENELSNITLRDGYRCKQTVRQTCPPNMARIATLDGVRFKQDMPYANSYWGCACRQEVTYSHDSTTVHEESCGEYATEWYIRDENAPMPFPLTRLSRKAYIPPYRPFEPIRYILEPILCEAEFPAEAEILVCGKGHTAPANTRCLYELDQFDTVVGCRTLAHLQNCDEFQCPSHYVKCPESFCIPVRYLCDERDHCPRGEDEVGCHNNIVSCSGGYRCRSSQVCIPLGQLCDGELHCPLSDDEQFCDFPCPAMCQCSAFTVNCSGRDIAFKDITVVAKTVRFIDISHNKHIDDCLDSINDTCPNSDMPVLIYLNMSYCNLRSVPEFLSTMPNLRVLDISFNKLTILLKDTFISQTSLSTLHLDGNYELQVIEPLTFNPLKQLRELLITDTRIKRIKKDTFKGLTLDILDLRNNEINTVDIQAFNQLSVTTLNIDGNTINTFDDYMFLGIKGLETLIAGAFKFCCLKPDTVSDENCYPEKDEFSSCADLMRNQTLAALMWIVGISALVGNILSLVYRIIWDRTKLKLGYGVFVTNLACADFLMGVYLVTIATADVMFRERYIVVDEWWRHSGWCNFAGVLSTISSETSVLLMVCITIDRLLAVKFPFGQLRIKATQAVLLAALCWCVAIVAAVAPLVFASYFQGSFYSKSGVCLALPISRDRPPGWLYSFSIFIVLNFFLFVAIAVGQVLIYQEVKETGFRVRKSKSRDMAVSRNLLLVVTTDFLCWFPIGCMGILALGGMVIPGDVYAWTAVLILPINSALNPLLYTFVSIISNRKARSRPASRNLANRNHADRQRGVFMVDGTHQAQQSASQKSQSSIQQSRHSASQHSQHSASVSDLSRYYANQRSVGGRSRLSETDSNITSSTYADRPPTASFDEYPLEECKLIGGNVDGTHQPQQSASQKSQSAIQNSQHSASVGDLSRYNANQRSAGDRSPLSETDSNITFSTYADRPPTAAFDEYPLEECKLMGDNVLYIHHVPPSTDQTTAISHHVTVTARHHTSRQGGPVDLGHMLQYQHLSLSMMVTIAARLASMLASLHDKQLVFGRLSTRDVCLQKDEMDGTKIFIRQKARQPTGFHNMTSDVEQFGHVIGLMLQQFETQTEDQVLNVVFG